MTQITIVTDKVALTLFERHGKRAMVHVEEQVKAALKKADWVAVKSWRHVGHEIEKLARFPGVSPARSISSPDPVAALDDLRVVARNRAATLFFD